MIRLIAQKRFFSFRGLEAVFFLFASLFPSALHSITDPIRFEHLTSRDGLSQSNVKCILQDRQGFLWFGTFDGLNKYDGYRFHIFRNDPDDPESLCGNDVYALLQDREGMLWIATSNGLSLYDPKMNRFMNDTPVQRAVYGKLGIRHIFRLLEDSAGDVWIGTHSDGLLAYRRQTREVEQFVHDPGRPGSLTDNRIRSLAEDVRGNIWAGTYAHGVNRYNRSTGAMDPFPGTGAGPSGPIGSQVRSITLDEKGALWFGCLDAGLSRLDPGRMNPPEFTHYTPGRGPGGLPSDQIVELLPDRRGGLWIGTNNDGLLHYDGNNGTFSQYVVGLNDPNTLNNNSIYALYLDLIGDLWIGTYAGGVNVIHQTNQAFHSYLNVHGAPCGIISNAVWDFDKDRDGTIWIAEDGGGLNRFDESSGRFSHFRSNNTNLKTDAVLSVCVDSRDQIWIGTWAEGLFLFDRERGSFSSPSEGLEGLYAKHIFNIVEDRKGFLWLATMDDGLIRFDPETGSYRAYTTRNSGILYDHVEILTILQDGLMAVGTAQGVCFYDPAADAFLPGDLREEDSRSLSQKFVNAIREQNDRILWIGTMNGLNRMDRTTGEIRRYYQKDGLPNNAIQALEFDDRGFLWISTNKGLSRMDVRNGDFRNFTVSDGLQGDEFIRNSSMKLEDGRLIFGGTDGFSIFNPDNIRTNPFVPPVVFTDFQIFNQSVKAGAENSPLKTDINWTDQLTLSHKQSAFSFEFAALNYTSPLKNRYAFYLEGFDPGWRYVDGLRTANYTNINPGRYVFRVKGSNNDGVWNEQGRAIQLYIQPPFWDTLWFRFLTILLGLSIIVLIFYYRTARIQALNRALEARVAERTAQLEEANRELESFGHSISHDLRAPLRAMIGFSRALMEDYGETLEKDARHYLDRIQKGGRRMEQLIDDLLKLSRHSKKPLVFKTFNLSGMVRSIADELLRSDPDRRVDVRIKESVEVYGDEVLIGIVMQNLLDNAWKFTSLKKEAAIEFGMTEHKGDSVFFVRDNGIGIDKSDADKIFNVFHRLHPQFEGTGIGLATVSRIIKRHGGRIWAEGKVRKGTVIYFTLTDRPA